MKHTASLIGLLLAMAAGCASAPRAVALDQSKALSESPSLSAAREYAPQAFAHAEQVRIRAEQAQSEGRTEEANALAQQALVAYERAATFARRIDIRRQLTEASKASEIRAAEVARVSALQAQVATETQALERSVELERTAEPRHPIEPESGKRAVAQAQAARSIAEAARLLCVAARLIAPKHEQPIAALTAVETLTSGLATMAPHIALGKAMDARVSCLAALTAARASSTPPTQEPDALLTKLSASMSELRPHQDDRGIVLTDYGTWDGNQLSPHGADVVGRIASVATASNYPVLVVLHGLRSSGAGLAPNHDALTQALRSKNLNAAVAVVSGLVPSLLDLPQTKDRSSRTEFILVTSN